MLFYTTCFCGVANDDIHELFEQIKYDMMVEKYKDEPDMVSVENLTITTEIDQISLNPIFEALGIKSECCKVRFMGYAQFEQLLK